MRIRVVVAVLEDLAKERGEQPAGEHRTLHRRRVDRRDVAERPPSDLVHDRMRAVDSVGCTAGIATPASPARLARNRAPASASCS